MEVNLRTAWALLRANPGFFVRKGYKKLLVEASRVVDRPRGMVTQECRGVRFEFPIDVDATVREMWLGAYELDQTDLLKRYLRPGDTFIDVGANLGYFSFVAAGCVGRGGQVHAFEPVPRYFQQLTTFVALNPGYRFVCNPCALGEAEGEATLQVTSIRNIGWCTMVPNFMPADRVGYQLTVPVHRLDQYIAEQGLADVAMIKIDVEGFEYPVLKGLESFLERAPAGAKPLLLVEVCPAAHRLLGHTVEELFAYLARFGYLGYRTWNLRKPVGSGELSRGITNVLFRPS